MMSDQHEGQWDDQRIDEAVSEVSYKVLPDMKTCALTPFSAGQLLRTMRREYEAQIDALRQELTAGQEWEIVKDGQYRDDPNVWQVWQGMVGVKSVYTKGDIYAGKLPDGWLLVRRLTPASQRTPPAPAVPAASNE